MQDTFTKPFVTPRELAESLGVGESSIKRWADEGRIAVGRTYGGHRRIPIDEAVRFVRESGLPLVNPDRLGLRHVHPVSPAEGLADPVEERLRLSLLEGRRDEAHHALLAAFFSGKTVATLADGPIARVLGDLGMLWTESERGIFIEHRAFDICVQGIRMIQSYLPTPNGSAPVALGGSPSKDIHALPSLLASAVLAENGWRAINLGAETPIPVLDIAAQHYHPALTWIAMSVEQAREDQALLSRQIRGHAKRLREWDGAVVVGGRAVPASLRKASPPNLRILSTMGELAELARQRLSFAGTGTLQIPEGRGSRRDGGRPGSEGEGQ